MTTSTSCILTDALAKRFARKGGLLRVLWVTFGQLPAAAGDRGKKAGGWIENLRSALEMHAPEIQLHVASWGSVAHAPFEEGNATYYAVVDPPPVTRGARLARMWRHSTIPTHVVHECQAIAAAVEPDVIHVHGSESFLGLVLERVSSPAVISLQGIASAYEDYMLASVPTSELLREVASRPFLHGDGLIHNNARFRVRAICERRTLPLCSDFIGRTEWDRAVIESIRPGAYYHHVDEVMNPVFYAPQWHEDGLAKMEILCVAGGSSLKGLEVMLRALSILRGKLQVPARLRVASHVHESGIWPYWQRLIRRWELQDAVTLLGALEPHQIAQELAGVSVFVHPSHLDNSPNALCEAMLVGVPCVASFVGGVPTLVDGDRTGLLYPDRDPFLLAAKIRQVLSSRGTATSLGAAARKAALTRHDPHAIAKRTLGVYEEIIRRRTGSGGV